MKELDLFVVKELDVNGLKLKLKIDYRKKTISFVDNDQGTQHKKWIFSERGISHLGGWLYILEAMKEATLYGDKLLRERIKLEEKRVLSQKIDIFAQAAGISLEDFGKNINAATKKGKKK